MLSFTPQSSTVDQTQLIPTGALAWAVFVMKEFKHGRESGGRYANIEVTIDGGPYNHRKVFGMISDPSDAANSENARRMGFGAVARMLESSGLVTVGQPDSYARFGSVSFDNVLRALDGRKVAIRVKIEKGKDGYADKNRIEFLSPNPESDTSKDFGKLMTGGPTAGGTANASAPNAMAGAPGAPAWAASQQPQQGGLPGFAPPPSQQTVAVPQGGALAAPAAVTTGGPAAPAWLQQAQSPNNDIPF